MSAHIICNSCGGVIWQGMAHLCNININDTKPFEPPLVVMGDSSDNIETQGAPSDPVNHPPHYKRGGLECIDVIDALGLTKGFCVGNAIKYLFRSGKKEKSTEIEDVKKSRWYIDHYLQYLEKGKE